MKASTRARVVAFLSRVADECNRLGDEADPKRRRNYDGSVDGELLAVLDGIARKASRSASIALTVRR